MLKPRTLGFLQAFFGTLAVTPDAVLLRLAERDGGGTLWITATFKLFFIAVFCMINPLRSGVSAILGGIRAAPTHFALAAAGQGLINMGYALSFLNTTVAQALMLISLHPMWGALAGRVLLKDKVPRRTAIALVSALGSVLIIFVPPAIVSDEEAAAAGTQRSSVHGNLLALATGLFLAQTIVVNRHAAIHRPDPRVGVALEAAAGIGSFACGVASLIVALLLNAASSDVDDFASLKPPFWPFVIVDGLCIAICTVLATVFAPRHLLGAEVGLILLGEQVLSPIWTYVGVGEAPAHWTLGGGALLVVTLACHEAAALFEERKESRAAPGGGGGNGAVDVVTTASSPGGTAKGDGKGLGGGTEVALAGV